MKRHLPFLSALSCLILFTILPKESVAQKPYFPFFQQEWFFGNHPSARTEALGKADVAIGGTVTSLNYNPAGIGTIQEWEANASTSGPYYLLRESDYLFAGYAKRVHEKAVVAFSVNQFAVGATTFDVTIGNQRYDIDNPRVDNYTLTLAAEPIKNLHIGLNTHLFSWKLFEDVASAKSVILDGGILYTYQLSSNRSLRAGASLVNAGFSTITFAAPDGNESSNNFPAIARAGVTFQQDGEMNVPGVGAMPVAFLVTTEIQDLLNNDYRNAWRLGTEVILANVLALRLGFFTNTEDDFGFTNNRSRINDITYGFGFIVPFNDLTNGNLPFTLHADYLSLEPAPVVFSGSRLPNKRVFSLRIVSPISSIQ